MTPINESTGYLEASLIGAALVDIAVVPECAVIVEPEDFEDHDFADVWRGLLLAAREGKPADPVLLMADAPASRRKAMGEALDAIVSGGHASVSCTAPWYARHIAERSRLRKLGRAGDVLVAEARALTTPAEEVAAKSQEALRAAVEAQYTTGPRLIKDTFEPDPEPEPGLRVAWPGVAGYLGAWRNRSLYVVAARTSVGKSAFLANVAASVAGAGVPVLFLSLEMPDKQLRLRVEAIESGISIQRLIELYEGGDGVRTMTLGEQNDHNVALDRIGGMPLYIQSGSVSLSKLLAVTHAWRLGRAYRTPALVCVDYIGLVRNPLKGRTREQEVSGVTAALKSLAMECDCPVLAAAQLNRGVDHRAAGSNGKGSAHDPTEPRLSDLRESGAIEQDADAVVFLHRNGERGGGTGPMRVIVAKNRQGPCGTATLYFDGPTTKFSEEGTHD